MEISDVQVETLNMNEGGNLVGAGPVGERLLSNGMDVRVLRPWFSDKYKRPLVNVGGRITAADKATLRKDEWKELDQTVVRVARERLRVVSDLENAGLTYNLTNGIGTTIFEYEAMSEAGEAQLTMDGLDRGRSDRVRFELRYLPLPIVSMDFRVNARNLASSRRRGDPLDTTMAAQATRRVSEKIEDIVFNGASTFTYGAGTIYGMKDAPYRSSVTLSVNWDELVLDSDGTIGEKILADVQSMIKAAQNVNHYGPFNLYIPKNYGYLLGSDYTVGTTGSGQSGMGRTIRERLLALEEVNDIRVGDKLDVDNVMLLEMTSETVQLIRGLDMTTVQWESEGGMALNFKIMAIMVPLFRGDFQGQSGLVHLA